MNWFYLSLKYFTQEQREYLVSILSSITSSYKECSGEEQNMIVYLFSKLFNYTLEERNLVYDFVLRRLLFECFALLYEVDKGQNFTVNIQKTDSDDWSSYLIVVRDDKTGELISSGFDVATNAEIQSILISNYNLSENTLHKLRITLEIPIDGITQGDAISTLGYIYLLTDKNIDINE
jgi:hypothetical protein